MYDSVAFYRSKTYAFEEFLFAWQDRLRKLEQPTAMSVKLQGEVDKYKVSSRAVRGITTCVLKEHVSKSPARPLSSA